MSRIARIKARPFENPDTEFSEKSALSAQSAVKIPNCSESDNRSEAAERGQRFDAEQDLPSPVAPLPLNPPMMKLPRPFLLAGLTLVTSCPALLLAADAAKTVTGYWEGTITAQRGEVPFAIEFVATGDNAWKGTAECLPQGVRNFAFDSTKVNGAAVEFALTGLPGDPRFKGSLAADGATLAGDVTQGDNVMPFRLTRTPKPAPKADPHAIPAKGEAGKGATGQWRGAISPVPGVELRLQANFEAGSDGKPTGHVLSLDQGSPPIAMEPVTEKDGAVQFDVPRIRGGFNGMLNADGSELAGEWTQGNRTTPLTFKRLAPKG